MVLGFQLSGHFAGLSFPNDAFVDLDHRNDLGAAAGQKTFICNEEIIPG